MASKSALPQRISLLATAIACACMSATALAAPPKVVKAPNSDPQCFAPWSANTKLFQYPAKKGPYRVALANGYIANTWRIQMIKTAKAYAAQPDVAAKLKEFKVVSTGSVTSVSTSSGARPGASVRMVTVGRFKSGKTSTGSFVMTRTPYASNSSAAATTNKRLWSENAITRSNISSLR